MGQQDAERDKSREGEITVEPVGWSEGYGINTMHTPHFAFSFSLFARFLW